MSTRVRKRIDQLFDESERAGRCAMTDDPNLAQGFYRCVRSGEAVSPMRRLFARRSHWEALSPSERAFHQIRALTLLRPDTVFCGPTAALVLGLSVPERLLSSLFIATTPSSHGRSSSKLIRVVIHDDDFTDVDGIKVTTLTRTVYDCLRLFDSREAQQLLHSATLASHLSGPELAHAIRHRYAGRRDITRVMSRLQSMRKQEDAA